MKKLFIYLITILSFFILGVIIANFVIMPSVVHKGREIEVPDVLQMALDSAVAELKKKGLEGVVTERRFDPIIEEGKVIIQEPLPKTKVKKGRIINLTVSLGPESIKVPYLTGIDIDKGKMIIKRLGFHLDSIEFIFSDTIPRNKIIRTVPDAEVELKKGDTIKLIISKGPVLKMPNLSGKNIDDAKIILEKLGLIIGRIEEVEGSGDKGSIIVQNPAPEQIVEPGDTVSLMVIK